MYKAETSRYSGPSHRKVYRKPCLQVYGSVAKITQSTTATNIGDNAGRANRKTGG